MTVVAAKGSTRAQGEPSPARTNQGEARYATRRFTRETAALRAVSVGLARLIAGLATTSGTNSASSSTGITSRGPTIVNVLH